MHGITLGAPLFFSFFNGIWASYLLDGIGGLPDVKHAIRCRRKAVLVSILCSVPLFCWQNNCTFVPVLFWNFRFRLWGCSLAREVDEKQGGQQQCRASKSDGERRLQVQRIEPQVNCTFRHTLQFAAIYIVGVEGDF